MFRWSPCLRPPADEKPWHGGPPMTRSGRPFAATSSEAARVVIRLARREGHARKVGLERAGGRLPVVCRQRRLESSVVEAEAQSPDAAEEIEYARTRSSASVRDGRRGVHLLIVGPFGPGGHGEAHAPRGRRLSGAEAAPLRSAPAGRSTLHGVAPVTQEAAPRRAKERPRADGA